MRVYDSNVFIMGNALQSFEEEYALLLNVPFCVGIGNGLDALTLALRVCNLRKDDEVIVPANTYIATWLAISRNNAAIVPVEPDDSLNIDPSKIENAITPRTRVILPVHLYGQPCDMDAITKIAEKHNLLIVEDNAQGHGAKWNNKHTGSFGVVNAHSFYPSKNLGALGDGGAITTTHLPYAEKIRKLRNYGFREKNIAELPGINSRLDEIQAAVLSIKLQHLEEWTNERRRLAALYNNRLAGVGDILLPLVKPLAHHVYHLYVIMTSQRDKLRQFLSANGVETMIHYPIPPHLQQAYRDLNFKKGDFSLTEHLADTLLSLPLWPGLRDDEVGYISGLIQAFFKKHYL